MSAALFFRNLSFCLKVFVNRPAGSLSLFSQPIKQTQAGGVVRDNIAGANHHGRRRDEFPRTRSHGWCTFQLKAGQVRRPGNDDAVVGDALDVQSASDHQHRGNSRDALA